MDFAGLLRRCADWDFSVSANRFSTRDLGARVPERLRDARGRLSAQRRAGERDRRRRGAGSARSSTSRPVRRRSSTRRPTASSAPPTCPCSTWPRWPRRSGPSHVLLVRAHYFYGADPQLAALHREGRIRDVAAHPSVEELCLAADVLLTDYSSIMFDYAVLDRPIVIHAPDWEAYRTLRGVYFDLTTERPGPWSRARRPRWWALRAARGRRRPRPRRVPGALLRAGRRPRRRARRAPGVAGRAGGDGAAPRAGERA